MKKRIIAYSILLNTLLMVLAGCDGVAALFHGDEPVITESVAVAAVIVSPATPKVAKGGIQQFTAVVTGTGNPAQSVTWTVSGGKAGTLITTSGVLAVAADESTATTLTVTATSTVDTTKSGTSAVTVTAPIPTVTNVTVDPASVSVLKGENQTFSATVTGTNSPAQTVTWAVSGGGTGTSISTGGVLTVAANESATTLTVTTTSTVDTNKYATAMVTIIEPSKAALVTAIEQANAAKIGVVTSTDGKDQRPGTKWVTDAVMTTFTNAIAAAQTVQSDTAATQNTIDAAVLTLNTAKAAFNPATAATTKSTLSTAIEQATAAKTGVIESATDPASGTKWVLPADLATFNAAISTAQVVNSNSTATQNEVDSAVTALNAAEDAFNSTVKNVTHGTAPVSLTFWVNEDNQILASNNSVTISKTGAGSYNASFTASISGGYDIVSWSVSGVSKSNNASVEIFAADYPTGTYRLGIIVNKNNVPYSTEISFIVTN